jgi:hypothetical protein
MPVVANPTPILAVFAIAAALAGCKDHSTPEEQVRATIARAEQAVEDKDLRSLAALVSDQFADGSEADKTAVLRIVQLQFLRHPSIHLLVRVPAVTFAGPGRAEATALVAMASLPIASPAELSRVSANLYRFDLVFVEEGKRRWRLRSATWAAVRPADFL